jgi:hypothetical protein
MSRYQGKLFHWKTGEVLSPSNCYTGDEYTDENTKLRMEIRYKEYKLKNLINVDNTTIKQLQDEIKELNNTYDTEKSILISNANYEMFPDNTLIQCQLISDDGKNIKPDGSFGNELVWCRVSDQRCFNKDILYAVNIVKSNNIGDKWFSTRASLTNWPRPNWAPEDYLKDCDKDDSVDTVSKYAVAFGGYDKIALVNILKNLKEDNDYDSEKEFLNEIRKDMKTAKYVCCDYCDEKDIEPNELAIGDLNLAQMGGGYAHENCMTDEQMEKYEESLTL